MEIYIIFKKTEKVIFYFVDERECLRTFSLVYIGSCEGNLTGAVGKFTGGKTFICSNTYLKSTI